MKRSILLGLGLCVLLSTQTYGEEEGRLERYGRMKYVRDGELHYGRSYYYEPTPAVARLQGRSFWRSLSDNLTGDKLAVFEEFGYTPHRLGYHVGDTRTERWKYYAEGVEFVFDENSMLVETRYFSPESNHID